MKKIKEIKIGYNSVHDEETINKKVSCGGKDEQLAKKINEIINYLNNEKN